MEKDLRSLVAKTHNRDWDSINKILSSFEIELLTIDDKSLLLCEISYYGKLDLLKKIISLGASVNHRHTNKENTLLYYSLGGYLGSTALGHAILGSRNGEPTFSVFRNLLENKADPNLITYSGYTPLQLAIVNDLPEYAVLLLSYGADLYKPSIDINEPNSFDFASSHKWARDWLERWRKEFE